jgi:hypothetical protein
MNRDSKRGVPGTREGVAASHRAGVLLLRGPSGGVVVIHLLLAEEQPCDYFFPGDPGTLRLPESP